MIRLRGQWIMLLAVSALFFWSGCVDQDFDEPPVRGLSTLEPNKTIADLLALGTGAGDVDLKDVGLKDVMERASHLVTLADTEDWLACSS